MAGRIEKLMPVADIALVERFERWAARDHQMEGDLWYASCVRFFHLSNRRISFNVWSAGHRPAFL